MGILSDSLIGLVNSFICALSLPFLLAGWIMKHAASSPCDPVIYKPLYYVGLFLLVVSIIGFLGSCCKCTFFLWVYLIVIFVLIVALGFVIVFGSVYMRASPGQPVEGMDYEEYRLQDFRPWLKNRLVDDKSWGDVKGCMVHHDICGKLETFRSIFDFFRKSNQKLSPVETACCKPPVHCGFEYMNATSWRPPKNGFRSEDPDCKLWSNNQDSLCYNCDTCKAGYLAMFLNYWARLNRFNIIVFIILLVVFIIGCCALR